MRLTIKQIRFPWGVSMKNMDETYCINIRNTLVFREGTVRVDADGNLLSLAVLSEGFYCALLNKLTKDYNNNSSLHLLDRLLLSEITIVLGYTF